MAARFVAAMEEVELDPPPTRIDGDSMSDEELLKATRVSRNIFNILKERLAHLAHPTARNHSIKLSTKITLTLVFLASGSYQWVIRGFSGDISAGAVSEIITEVVQGLCALAPEYIKFPMSPPAQLQVKQCLMNIAGIPNLLGLIDGTHIHLRAPHEDEHLYVDKNHRHSINVQIICDGFLRISNIIARYHGSTHDSFIWKNCELYELFQSGDINGMLLADKGYALETFVMTPLHNPSTAAEIRYNDAHSLTRSKVECCIGVLKSRWRCLMTDLHYSPQKVCQIVIACAVLHNLCKLDGMPDLIDEDVMEMLVGERQNEAQPGENHQANARRRRQAAERVRQGIINDYFTH